MNIRASLSFRVSLYVIGALIIGTVADWLVFQVRKGADFDLNLFAEVPVRTMVVNSVVTLPGGSLEIEPSAALKARVARMPSLRYAVFDPVTGMALPGSSTDLAAALLPMTSAFGRAKAHTVVIEFELSREADSKNPGWLMREEETRFGPLLVADSGYQFEWSDVPLFIERYFEGLFSSQGPIYVYAALVVGLSIWRGHAPLRRIAGEARSIDVDRLSQKLTTRDVPSEVHPLVEAFNAALARLDEGVARERRVNANAAHELRTPIAVMLARLGNPREEELNMV